MGEYYVEPDYLSTAWLVDWRWFPITFILLYWVEFPLAHFQLSGDSIGQWQF